MTDRPAMSEPLTPDERRCYADPNWRPPSVILTRLWEAYQAMEAQLAAESRARNKAQERASRIWQMYRKDRET